MRRDLSQKTWYTWKDLDFILWTNDGVIRDAGRASPEGDLKGPSWRKSRGRMFQKEGTAPSKSQWWECSWCG